MAIAVAQPAAVQARTDTPWHAVGYAYLNILFLLNLKPVDWALIETVLTTDHDGRILGHPAIERLRQIDQTAGTAHAQAIETALGAQNPAALHAATTRALSAAIRQHLGNAAKVLEQPGLANAEIEQAQALFRALANGIGQTDPEGFHMLGLAWLELASSVRQIDAIAAASLPAEHEAFASARSLLEDYLITNFEPEAFVQRARFAPIPENRLLANPGVTMAPWLPPGSDMRDQDPLPRPVLNFDGQGIDETDLPLVAYGHMLFRSPEIFGDPARSLGIACSTCHNRGNGNQRFFVAGISPHPGAVDVDASFFNARFNDRRHDPLDIPSLRGVRFTGPYGRDGRFASLRDFTRHLIVNGFRGPEPTPLILDALTAYMMELDFLPAPHLERDGRLTASAPEAAKRGEELFTETLAAMGNRSCAHCHLPSSHFTDNQVHDIGSAGDGAAGGFSGAFDTPTLLGILHTAPYLHDGRLPTLAAVVDWKNDIFDLGLGEAERADLTAYLEAVGEGTDPYQPAGEETTWFRRMVEDCNVFLSTLDILIPDRDRRHADLLLRTVAKDMERDAGVMTNREARNKVQELADQLWTIRDMIKQDAWDEAGDAWRTYGEMARAHIQDLR